MKGPQPLDHVGAGLCVEAGADVARVVEFSFAVVVGEDEGADGGADGAIAPDLGHPSGDDEFLPLDQFNLQPGA